MKTHAITAKEIGYVIDDFNSLEDAKKALRKYEAEDVRDGIFEPDFYEIVPLDENGDVVHK